MLGAGGRRCHPAAVSNCAIRRRDLLGGSRACATSPGRGRRDRAGAETGRRSGGERSTAVAGVDLLAHLPTISVLGRRACPDLPPEAACGTAALLRSGRAVSHPPCPCTAHPLLVAEMPGGAFPQPPAGDAVPSLSHLGYFRPTAPHPGVGNPAQSDPGQEYRSVLPQTPLKYGCQTTSNDEYPRCRPPPAGNAMPTPRPCVRP